MSTDEQNNSQSSNKRKSVIAFDDVMTKVAQLLFNRYKINFQDYKASTIRRRIKRRAASLGFHQAEQYADYLNSKPDEIENLYRDFLIGVTSFFRDKEAFEQLKTQVLPGLLKQACQEKRELRVWIPACSSGEEVYSIAILLAEEAEKQHMILNAKIFASDINQGFLGLASTGSYSEEAVASVPLHYLTKYFAKKDKCYQINKALRALIVFAPYNVISTPPFTRMDLISCRNFLIYITKEAQQKVINSLRFGLKMNGYLFLGPSEAIGEKSDDLEVLDNKWKLYKKIRPYCPSKLNLPTLSTLASTRASNPVTSIIDKTTSFPLYAYHEIIKRIISLGFILDENRKVMHTFGNIKTLLHVPEGVVDSDILNMIHADLKVPLSTGLYRAKNTHDIIRYENVRIEETSSAQLYNLIVLPIYNEQSRVTYFLVRFEVNVEKNREDKEADFNFDAHAQQIIKELEGELHESRDLLQTTMEEVETTNEELQSTNEELLASNEEMQSTNEELHSANAELNSVNYEYQRKLQELILLDNDVDNLLRSIDIGTIFVDEYKALKLFNPAMQKYFNILKTDIGRLITHFSHDLTNFIIGDIFEWVVLHRKLYEEEIKTSNDLWLLLRATPAVSKEGKFTGVIYTFTDITKAKHSEQRLEQLAHYDSLTKLPNRESFLKQLSQSIQEAYQKEKQIAVFFIDIDNFKQVNDCLGHDTGNKLLQCVAHTMRSLVGAENYLARIGGDEFGIITPIGQQQDTVEKKAEMLIKAFSEPLNIYNKREVKISLSIGVAYYPDAGSNSHDLIRHADMAMYHAKGNGKDSYCVFNDILSQKITKRHLLENHLRHAVSKGELSIVFQPQIDTKHNTLIGYEALARWHSNKLGTIPPQEFIQIAEESKLIISIGECLFDAACLKFSQSEVKNKAQLTLSINLSAKQFMVPGLASFIKKTLQHYEIDPKQIILEITESVLMEKNKPSKGSIDALRELGISFALDDFGTGYSSMKLLKEIPVKMLKIDREFIKDIASNESDPAIVLSIVALAKGLGMKVIAEGVEMQSQVACLQSCGCYLMQGFLFGTPMQIGEATKNVHLVCE